jgi:hypothetical protein
VAEFLKKTVSVIVTEAVVAELGMYITEAEVYAMLSWKLHVVKVTVAVLFKELAINKDAPKNPA